MTRHISISEDLYEVDSLSPQGASILVSLRPKPHGQSPRDRQYITLTISREALSHIAMKGIMADIDRVFGLPEILNKPCTLCGKRPRKGGYDDLHCQECDDRAEEEEAVLGTEPFYEHVLAAIRAARRVYETSPTGCCLHITLDDGNVEDHSLDFCHEEATKKNHKECLVAVATLRPLSINMRKLVYGAH